MSFRKVLVGLDLEVGELNSEDEIPAGARRLFDRALAIASAQRGEMRLCAVIDGLDLTRVPISPRQVSAFAGFMSARLERLAEEAREAGVACETELLGGFAGIELRRQAEEMPADLLVVGAGSRPNQMGATASKLLRVLKCPVLVERFPNSAAMVGHESASTAVDDDEVEPPHVLIADDLSEVGQHALMTFVGSGLWRDAKGWLVHVIEPDRWPEAWRCGMSEDDFSRRQVERQEAARQRLHLHLSVTDHRTMTFGILPDVVAGHVAETLRRIIDERRIDLLVCGAASRADEWNLGFGKTAEALFPHISCSLLAFKPNL